MEDTMLWRDENWGMHPRQPGEYLYRRQGSELPVVVETNCLHRGLSAGMRSGIDLRDDDLSFRGTNMYRSPRYDLRRAIQHSRWVRIRREVRRRIVSALPRFGGW